MGSDPFALDDPAPTPEPIPFPSPVVPAQDPEDARIALGAKRTFARAQAHLAQSLAYAAQQKPDAYAANVRTADQLGVQPELVDGAPELHEAVYQQDQATQVDRITRDHPELARWLTDPSNASLVHDDLGAMRTLDVAMRAAADLTVDPSGYLPAGFKFNDQGSIVEPLPGGLSTVIGGFTDLDRELTRRGERQADEEDQLRGLYAQGGDSRFLAGAAASLAQTKAALGLANDADRAYADRIAAASSLVHPGEFTPAGIFNNAVRGLGGLTADLPLMFAGGGVLSGAKYATDVWQLGGQLGRIAEPIRQMRRALQASGKIQGYLRGALEVATVSQPLAIREGLATADEHGAANGAMSWLIETAVPGAFGRTGTELGIAMTTAERQAQTLAMGHSWLNVVKATVVHGSGYEGAEEAVTELAHAVHERVSGIDPRALETDRLLARLTSAGILGGIAGGAFAAPHEAIAKLGQDLLAHDQAITFRNRVGAVAKAVETNPLTERAPERMRGLITEQTGNLQLFYQTEEWDEHWQAQGMDPIKAADLFGIRDQYLTAKAHGGEMAVPLAHVVMPSTDPKAPKDVKALLDLGRQAPGAPNAVQADAFDDQAKQQVADLVQANTPAKAEPAPPDMGEVIGSRLAANLEAAGRSKQDAAAYGQLFGTIFRTLGERLGVDPQALSERFPVTVEAGADTGQEAQAAQTYGQSSEVRDRFAQQLAANPDAALAEYVANEKTKGGKILAADEAKKLSPEFVADGSLAHDVHPPSSDFVDGLYHEYLETGAHPGPVLFMAGGAGSGKSTAIENRGLIEGAGIVLDGTFSNYDAAKEKVESALAAGRTVELVYVHAPIEVAVQRMVDRALAEKRAVPLGVAADKHFKAQATFLQMAREYAADDRVRTTVIDNSGAINEATVKSVEWLESQRYASGDEIRQRTREAYEPERYRLPAEYDRAFLADLGSEAGSGTEAGRTGAGRPAQRPQGPGQTLGHGEAGDRRASISFGPNGAATIRLFQTANRSSVLHEMGHLWLEVLGDLAGDANAAQQVKDDYAAALSFLGVEKRGDIKTEHHELFARGFENYLATGKAPSIATKRLFARFRAWMLSIYRNLLRLNVTLTPEITGVFDRLIATDAEIAAAEHEAAVHGLFSTAEQAGKTPEQFAAYSATVQDAHDAAVAKLEAELVSRYQQEEQAAYREERATVRAEVEAEAVTGSPVYQAMLALQDGLEDGTTPKLSKAGVLEYVDAANLDLLPGPAKGGGDRPNRGRRIYTADPGQGMHPSEAAGLFGFPSGDALMRALMNAPDLGTLIDARTDDVMKERHPDPMTDGKLHERAQEAIQSEEREKVVREELSALRALERASRGARKMAVDEAREAERQRGANALSEAERDAEIEAFYAKSLAKAKLDTVKDEARQAKEEQRGNVAAMREAVLPIAVYREAAKQIIANTAVAEIRPNQYLVAAGTNARKAFTLVNKAKPTAEDYAEAAQAKEQEILSMELYRAARLAIESTEKTRAYLEGFQEEKTRQKIGRAGGWEWTVSLPDGTSERVESEAEARKLAINGGGTFDRSSGYLEQIDALLERFDLAKARRSGPALARRESLRDWIMRQEFKTEDDGTLVPTGVVADIPDRLRDEAFSKQWRSLTMGELSALRDAVENIAHLANTKNRLMRQSAKRTLDETVDDIASNIVEHGRKRDVRANRTGFDQVGNFFEGYLAAHRKMASLARVIDGGKDGGAAWEAFIRPLNEAADAELAESGKASAKLMALLKEWGKPDGPVKAVPELGGAELSTIGKVMVALNWGNAGNRQRILNEGWTADQIGAFLSTLDAKDLALVNGVWDLIGSYWSDIKAKMQRMSGLPAERVEAIPFEVTTADGTTVKMRGGYFPIVYDDARSPNHSALSAAAQAELSMRGASMRATTARGHEKSRQKVVAGKRLLFSPSVITGHLNQVIHDLTHHEVIQDASRLLSDKRLAKEMHDHYGPQMAKQFRKGLEDVAAGEMGANDMVERSVRWIRSGVSIAAMGFNATSALMQITGISQSMVRVGPKYMGKAIARIFRDATSLDNSATFVDSKSGFMKARGTTMVRELREAIHRSDVGVARRGLTQAAYFMMAKMQRAVDVPTWLASYEKSLDQGKSDDDAVAIADQTIIDTQGSGFVKDLSAVQRNKALAIFTPFMHYLNVQMNLTAESVSRLRQTGDVMRFAGDMLLLYTVPAVFSLLLKDLLRGAPEDEEESFAMRAAKEHLTMLLGTTLITREAGALIQSDRDYSGPAGTRGIAALVNFGHQALQGELDHGLERATVEALGMALRLPTVAVQRLVDAAVSDSEDNQVRAALFGKRPKK